MSVIAGVVTIVVQSRAGAVAPLGAIPLSTRVANAVVSMAAYLWQMVWPAGLAAIYPYPPAAPVGPAAIAALVVIAITIAAVGLRRRAPYLLAGWLWYLVTIVPVLGLIQAGPQARAVATLSLVSVARGRSGAET